MASKRKAPETLDGILAPLVKASGLSMTDWCDANDLNPRTVYRLRRGASAHLGTLHMLATATDRTVGELQKAIANSKDEA